jgi:hypothetical protein
MASSRAFIILVLFIILSPLYPNANTLQDEGLGDVLVDASDIGDIASVSDLIKKGHKIDQQGFLGVTALMRASYKGHINIVGLLLSFGASVAIKDEGSATALHYAVRAGNLEIVHLLIEAGANIDIKDSLGHTPLQRAQTAKNKEMLEIMNNHKSMNFVALRDDVVLITRSTDEIESGSEPSLESTPTEAIEISLLMTEAPKVKDKPGKEIKEDISTAPTETQEESVIADYQDISPNEQDTSEENSLQDSDKVGLKVSEAIRVEEDDREEYGFLIASVNTLNEKARNLKSDNHNKSGNAGRWIQIKLDGFKSPEDSVKAWDKIAKAREFKSSKIKINANGNFSRSELFLEIGFFPTHSDAYSGCLKALKILPNAGCSISHTTVN